MEMMKRWCDGAMVLHDDDDYDDGDDTSNKQQANWNIAHTPPGTAENRWQWGRALKVG